MKQVRHLLYRHPVLNQYCWISSSSLLLIKRRQQGDEWQEKLRLSLAKNTRNLWWKSRPPNKSAIAEWKINSQLEKSSVFCKEQDGMK